MSAPASSLRVRSGDLTLAVREHSPAGAGRATVVLVHGYPDQQDTWHDLVDRLPLEDWHVVTFDVRGAGASDVPATRRGYRTGRLVDDLVAVLDEVLPDGERAHLVGHDWGSVQLWDAVAAESTDPRLRGRLASFTSVSGPSLDHAGLLMRRREERQVRLLRQALHSWYVYAFHVPVLPDLFWRHAHRLVGPAMAAGQRLPRGHWGAELGSNAANGLNLYRANVLRRLRHPRRFRTHVPVLVVHPNHDGFLTDVLLEDLETVCCDVRVVRVEAGHWVHATHPELVAGLVMEHVRRSSRDRTAVPRTAGRRQPTAVGLRKVVRSGRSRRRRRSP